MENPVHASVVGNPALTVRAVQRQLAALLPEGPFSTAPLSEVIGEHTSGAWPRLPRLKLTACDYGTGRRVVFEKTREPAVPLGLAVAAS